MVNVSIQTFAPLSHFQHNANVSTFPRFTLLVECLHFQSQIITQQIYLGVQVQKSNKYLWFNNFLSARKKYPQVEKTFYCSNQDHLLLRCVPVGHCIVSQIMKLYWKTSLILCFTVNFRWHLLLMAANTESTTVHQ